jgi:hypothetical protein
MGATCCIRKTGPREKAVKRLLHIDSTIHNINNTIQFYVTSEKLNFNTEHCTVHTEVTSLMNIKNKVGPLIIP